MKTFTLTLIGFFTLSSWANENVDVNSIRSECGSIKIKMKDDYDIDCYSSTGSTYRKRNYNTKDVSLYRTCTGFYEVFDHAGNFLNSCYSVVKD